MVQLWDVCMEDKSVLRNQGRHDSMTGMAVTFTAALCRCVHPFAALSIPLSQKAILKQNYGWLADFVWHLFDWRRKVHDILWKILRFPVIP